LLEPRAYLSDQQISRPGHSKRFSGQEKNSGHFKGHKTTQATEKDLQFTGSTVGSETHMGRGVHSLKLIQCNIP